MDPHVVLGPVDPQTGDMRAASIVKLPELKHPSQISDDMPVLADVAQTARVQVAAFAADLLLTRLPKERAAVLATVLSEECWTHDFPITVEAARALGPSVSTEMPALICDLMDLYPQTGTRRPFVMYVPLRRGNARERGESGTPAASDQRGSATTPQRRRILQNRSVQRCHRRSVSSLSFVRGLALLAAVWAVATSLACAQTRQTLSIRGHRQTLYLCGQPTGDPVVVSSGDGGWIHLAPHVAELLRANGYFVVGFDVRGYLASFTSGSTTLRPQDEPGDYRVLAEFAAKATGKKPILMGVSEGAGLSVLAATDPRTKAAITGVIGLGLPELSELGWHWKDAIIYVTKQTPHESTFSASAIVDRVAPLPLAAIQSTQDEFVPVAEVQRVLRNAKEPKRLWIVMASDHRFSDNLAEFDRRLLEAIAWVKQHSPR
jgi:hypothetical protein